MTGSWFQGEKLELVHRLGLSKDALHIYVGLGVFLLATLLSKRRFGSPMPWLLVLAVVLAGEAWDAHDDLVSGGHWRWWASAHDAWNTLFWPTVLLILGRLNLLRRVGAR